MAISSFASPANWQTCTSWLAHVGPDVLSYLQVRRARQAWPEVSQVMNGTVRETNLLVVASFLSNLN